MEGTTPTRLLGPGGNGFHRGIYRTVWSVCGSPFFRGSTKAVRVRSDRAQNPFVLAAAAFVFAFAIAFLRRGDTLVHPQLWAEDGTFMVPHFLAEGWWPLKGDEGYLTIVPHVIDNLALTIAPYDSLTVSTWLAWLFMAGVAALIAGAPTVLRGCLAFALGSVPILSRQMTSA